MRHLARAAIAVLLPLAVPGWAMAADALIPPAVPRLPAASAPAAESIPPASAELAGSSAAAGQPAGTNGGAGSSRQRHHRRRILPVERAERRPAPGGQVDRATADRLTNQLNQRELERMRSAERPVLQPPADALNREQLEPR